MFLDQLGGTDQGGFRQGLRSRVENEIGLRLGPEGLQVGGAVGVLVSSQHHSADSSMTRSQVDTMSPAGGTRSAQAENPDISGMPATTRGIPSRRPQMAPISASVGCASGLVRMLSTTSTWWRSSGQPRPGMRALQGKGASALSLQRWTVRPAACSWVVASLMAQSSAPTTSTSAAMVPFG